MRKPKDTNRGSSSGGKGKDGPRRAEGVHQGNAHMGEARRAKGDGGGSGGQRWMGQGLTEMAERHAQSGGIKSKLEGSVML